MDALSVGSLLALTGGLIIAVMQMRGVKGTATQTGADEFRGDLLVRISQQDTKIDQQNAKIERLEGALSEALVAAQRLQGELAALTGQLAEERVHVAIVTDWGRNAPGAPPRTPPPWRNTQ